MLNITRSNFFGKFVLIVHYKWMQMLMNNGFFYMLNWTVAAEVVVAGHSSRKLDECGIFVKFEQNSFKK